MAAIRTKLVEAGGDIAKAGLTTQDVRNAIYTKAFRVNPNVENQPIEGAAPKPKRSKKDSKSTSITKLTAEDMDNLMG
jgi:hypothetical protein